MGPPHYLLGVYKHLSFWFKSVEDCYIRVSLIVETKCGPFDLKKQQQKNSMSGKTAPLFWTHGNNYDWFLNYDFRCDYKIIFIW